jgi:hypothetical protein
MNDHQAMRAIHREMDGTEWDSGTMSAIANILDQAGYRLRDLNDVDGEPDMLDGIPDAQLDKAWMLVIGSESELNDLIDWIHDHPSEEEMDEEGIPITTKARLDTWLRKIQEESEADAYPAYIPVPLELVNLLNMLIEDWSEVEGAHGETFTTVMVSSEG